MAVVAALLLVGGAATASQDYKELYEEENRPFYEAAATALHAKLRNEPARLRRIYEANGMRPIWFDREGLTPHTHRFIELLEEDLRYAPDSRIKRVFHRLMNESRTVDVLAFPMEKKIDRELEVTRLFLDYFDPILGDGKSRFTPESLLIHSLRRGSLAYGLNAVVQERLARRTVRVFKKGPLVPGGGGLEETLRRKLAVESDEIRSLYETVEGRPVWVGPMGYARRTAELFAWIGDDPTLEPDGAMKREARRLRAASVPDSPEGLVARELEVMRLFERYARHHLYGEIDWERFRRKLKERRSVGAWIPHKVLASPATLLASAVDNGSLRTILRYSQPPFHTYRRTLEALRRYRGYAASGGWLELYVPKTLRPGIRGPAVQKLRERLAAEGYRCEAETSDPALYDKALARCVEAFQRTHGLDADGLVGRRSVEAFNVPVEARIATLKLNLDRMKWFKERPGRYHILVNIPEFAMRFFDRATPVQKMRVVVGKPGHETPIFYNRVKRITLNPYWRIPPSIVRREIVPRLIADPHYAQKRRIEIHTGPSENSPRVDPLQVEWRRYRGRTPPYYFMQSPGPKNSLGLVKYLFPNEYAVYMHDTPAKALFKRSYRAFSHGCIRLERPFDLLKIYASVDGNIDYDKAMEIVQSGQRTRIYPKEKIPVDTVYLTAWEDREGRTQFRDDLYGYDKLQLSGR